MKTIINVECVDQDLIVTNSPVIASGGLHENFIAFKFCSKWDGFTKTAVFYKNTKEPYRSIVDEENMCEVPHEVTDSEGTMYFGVFGVSGEVTRTSKVLKYKIKQGAITEDLKPSEPSPDIYQQILSEYNASHARLTNLETAVIDLEEGVETATNIAKGRNQAHVFTTTEALQNWLSNEDNKGLYQVGDNLYIVEVDVPDWWVAEVLDEADAETGYYYKIAQLETQKVDLVEFEKELNEINSNLDNRTFLMSDINSYSTVLEWALANPNTESLYIVGSNMSDGSGVTFGKYWCVGTDAYNTGITVFSQQNNSSRIFVRTIGGGAWMDEWDELSKKSDITKLHSIVENGFVTLADANNAEVGKLEFIKSDALNGIGRDCFLMTFGAYSGHKRQIAFDYHSNVMGTRRFDGENWQAWDNIVQGADLANYLPLTGGDITGNLCAKRFVYASGQGNGVGINGSSYALAPFLSEAQYAGDNTVRAGYGFHNAGSNATFLFLDIDGKYRTVAHDGSVSKIIDSSCFTISDGVLTIFLD